MRYPSALLFVSLYFVTGLPFAEHLSNDAAIGGSLGGAIGGAIGAETGGVPVRFRLVP